MRAAVISKFKDQLEIKELSVPEVGNKDVLVKIQACGVCHTDLHACHGDWPVKPQLPLVPGHEGVGEIVSLGADVKHLKIGDRVGIPWLYSACGQCEYCLSGRETLCLEQQNCGYSVNGSFAQFCLADGDYVVKVPDGLSAIEAAPLFCAGVTSYKALKESGVKAGEWVAIYGVGGLGHLAIQYAKALGMKVIAVDTGTEKLALAKELGAAYTLDYQTQDCAQQIQQLVGGAHGVVCTAVSKEAFEASFHSLRRGATFVLVGLPAETISLPIFDTVLKGIKVVGSIVGTRQDLQECLAFAADGLIKAIVEVRSLEEINQIFTEMENAEITGRIVIEMN
ncbi:MAG: alcohol dehydrogenase AdhP [Oceanospirillaceae bacterium]|nr:alcohol dehydrogenase AdhP [Oceanospirillaceae bacterium]